MARTSLNLAAIPAALLALSALAACADSGPAPDATRVTITGGVKSANQPQGEGNASLGVEAGALASSGLAIVALDTAGNTVSTGLTATGTFRLEVAPNTSYTLNLLDTTRNVYIASFLYRSGASVELALSVGETDIALGECQVFNGEMWCDKGFFDPDDQDVVELPSDMYGRLRATVHASESTRDLVSLLLGGTTVEYDLAPNPLNRFHVALTRHDGDTCANPLTGVAEKVGDERYLYTGRAYANATCNATVRFQVMCSMVAADRCVGFLRVDIVSSGVDCSEYPPMHVAEPLTIDVLEPGVVTCPLPPTCSDHSDCESGVCNNDVGFCAVVPETSALRIHVFDVGNGQSVLAVTPSGKSILMDAGRPQSGRMVAAMVRRIVPRIDVFVLSHFDADHAGGAVPIMLGPDGYPGRRGYDDDKKNGVDDEGEIGSPGSDDLLPGEVLDRGLDPMPAGFDDYARILGSRRREPVAGEVYDFEDGVTMQVLTVNGRVAGGTGVAVDEENARSVGVLFRYGDFSLANLGDLPAGGLGTAKVEQLIVPAVLDDLPLDVHFLSHHGSKASSPPELLKALRPRVAIISVGDSDRCGAGFNSYGLPAQEVLDAVNAANATEKIYQTGEGGASFKGECIPEPNQVYPRDYGETPYAFAYSVFTIEAYEERFRVSGLTFDDSYDAVGCSGDACSGCPIGYLEHPTDETRCIVDPCVPDPCNARGACSFVDINRFACACEPNFDGPTCNTCDLGYAGDGCDVCDIGFLADPGAPVETLACIDDPCAPDPCNARGTCTVLAGGAASCECEGNFGGDTCDTCDSGYTGAGCMACAEGFVADPADLSRCVADPCLANPCGANGSCAVVAGGAFMCDCAGNWAGATCNTCATGYAGDTCTSCASGYVPDPTGPTVCVPDLCTPAACGGRGDCTMVTATTYACDCIGNFQGLGCAACTEGYAGATCEDCAPNTHEVDGICAPNRTVSACRLTTAQIWAEPGVHSTVEATVSVAGMNVSEGDLVGLRAQVCWREGPLALPIAWPGLTCAPASFAGNAYAASIAFPSASTFRYIAAFSGDGGATWTSCDLDGAVASNLRPGVATVFNVQNGGFEVEDGPLDRWFADSGLDVEAEVDLVHFGQRSVRLTRTTTNNAEADFTASAIPVVPGRNYTISMWFWDFDPRARANVVYAFYDNNDAQLGATSFGGVYTADSALWQNIARPVTAPANAAYIRVATRIYTQAGATTGGSIVLDDVAVVPNP